MRDPFVGTWKLTVEYLKTLKSVDGARIGIIGHSHGGYTVLRSIVAQPDLFAAAVDVVGPSDMLKAYRYNLVDFPEFSEIRKRAIARLMGGTPEQKPEAYRTESPIHFVERIKTPLLILHGTADQPVPYRQSAELAEALDRAKKQYEFITYQGAGHGFIFGGKHEVDANQQILRFLLTHLKGPQRE